MGNAILSCMSCNLMVTWRGGNICGRYSTGIQSVCFIRCWCQEVRCVCLGDPGPPLHRGELKEKKMCLTALPVVPTWLLAPDLFMFRQHDQPTKKKRGGQGSTPTWHFFPNQFFFSFFTFFLHFFLYPYTKV